MRNQFSRQSPHLCLLGLPSRFVLWPLDRRVRALLCVVVGLPDLHRLANPHLYSNAGFSVSMHSRRCDSSTGVLPPLLEGVRRRSVRPTGDLGNFASLPPRTRGSGVYSTYHSDTSYLHDAGIPTTSCLPQINTDSGYRLVRSVFHSGGELCLFSHVCTPVNTYTCCLCTQLDL